MSWQQWTTPRTWQPGETATDDIFNAELRDNFDFLMGGRAAFCVVDNGVYTTTSTTYVPVNSIFTVNMVTWAPTLVCGVSGNLVTSGGTISFAIGIDGGNEELVQRIGTGNTRMRAWTVFTGLSPAQHTPTLRWRISSGTATLRGTDDGGAGVAYPRIIFWGIEI